MTIAGWNDTARDTNLAGSAYSPFGIREQERERNEATVKALSRIWYGRAFEPGCSVGGLTAQLARRCVQVTATASAPEFVAQTEARCARFPNVEVHQASLADDPPLGTFDLIVLSDFGCHFAPKPLIQLVLRMVGQLQPGGEIVAAHSLGASRHPLSGDTVHNLLKAQLPLEWTHGQRHDDFRIDVWRYL
jgi:SAM-dependent methyltransferase